MKPKGEALFRYYDGGVYITGWGFILVAGILLALFLMFIMDND